MADKIYKKLIRQKTGRYRLDFDDVSRVEITDQTSEDFSGSKTCFHFKKWDEFGVKLTPKESTAACLSEEKTLENIDRLKVNDGGKDYHLQCYCLDEKEGRELGGLEIETVWESKPVSNKVVFDLDFDEGVQFLYQPPLYEDFDVINDKRVDQSKTTATYAYNTAGRVIHHRPEDKVGSFAIYGPKKDNKYKTGKIGHIDRPKAVDAKGCEVWCTLSVDLELKTLVVTVPQSYVDSNKTKYPVIVDPTFGYTTIGSTTASAEDTIIGVNESPGESGVVTALWAYHGPTNSLGDRNRKMALYAISGSALQSPQSEEKDNITSSAAWNEFSVTGSLNITNQNYAITMWAADDLDLYRDTGGSPGDSKYANETYSGTWPSTVTFNDSSSSYSTYAVYNTDIAVTGIGTEDIVCPDDTGIPVEGNIFESSQGTNGKVEFGNESTYGACTVIEEQTVTAWTDTEITITAVAGDLSAGPNWVYVTNDSEERSAGYPFTLKCEWGLLSVETSDTTVDWARAMGGEPPDKDDMILKSASVYIGDSHSTQLRVAVYQGGSLSDGPDAEDGATLLKDFGQISGSATGTWIELTHEGADIPIDKDDPLWVAVKGTGSDTSVRYKGTPAPSPMDFQEDEGRYVSSAISSTETVAWPSTWPSDSGSFSDYWYSFKLSYEIAPSVVELAGAFTEEDDLSGVLSFSVPITGAFEETDQVEGALGATVELAGAFTESDQVEGTLDAAVELAGAFTESDQVGGSIEIAAGLEGSFEESDQVEGTLDAAVELAGAFEESDQVEGTLFKIKGLEGAFTESDQVEGILDATVELAGAFEESDQVEGILDATVELAGAFEESDQVEGTLGAAVELAGSFEESDQVEGTLDAAVELAGSFEESDQVEGSLEISGFVNLIGSFEESDQVEGVLDAAVELAGAFEESDQVEGTLGAAVELEGAFEESDDLEGTLLKISGLSGAFEESDQVEGTLGATVELAGAFEESDQVEGSIEIAAGMEGAFEESDQVEGILEAAVELAGTFEETDQVEGTLSISGLEDLIGAFEESDDLEGSLSATVELSGAFEESDQVEGILDAAVELAGAFEESDQVEGSIEIAAGLEGSFEESDQVEGTLGATVALEGAFTETDDIIGSMSAVVELAGGFTESDDLSAALTASIEMAAAFTESDQVEGTLGATVELVGGFTESDQVEGTLRVSGFIDLVGGFTESDQAEGVLGLIETLQGAFTELDNLKGVLSIPGQITTSNVLGRILTTEGPKGSVLTVSGPKGLAVRR
ncbi:MAG: hypothetical protein GY841_00980 [FCB group bacterium]|nr:hypothetical protein [FCB group bacterium]